MRARMLIFALLMTAALFAQNSRFEIFVRNPSTNLGLSGATVYIVHEVTGDSLNLTEVSGKPGLYRRDNVEFGNYKVYVNGALATTGKFHATNRIYLTLTNIDADGDYLIDAGSFEAGAIGNADIAAGAVTSDKLADEAVTSAKLAPLSVTGSHLFPDIVGAGHIKTGAVNNDELGANAVDSTKIIDGGVSWNDLSPSAQDSAKLGSGGGLTTNSVTSAHIRDDEIQSIDILNGDIQSIDLANGAVDNLKLAANAVDSTKIKDGGVSWNDLSPAAQDSARLGSGGGSSLISAPSTNLLVGQTANILTTGVQNVIISNFDNGVTSGNENLLVGRGGLSGAGNKSSNVLLGYNAYANGDSNIVIGRVVDNSWQGTANILIGENLKTTASTNINNAIGIDAVPDRNNVINIANKIYKAKGDSIAFFHTSPLAEFDLKISGTSNHFRIGQQTGGVGTYLTLFDSAGKEWYVYVNTSGTLVISGTKP